MEIIIKAKQKFNPFFSFLDHNDDLFPYYQHIKEMLTCGAYVPRQSSPVVSLSEEEDRREKKNDIVARGGNKGSQDSKERDERTGSEPQNGRSQGNDKESSGEEDDSDSDDDGGYLHPLLMGGGLRSSSKSSTPNPGTREASPSVQLTSTASVSIPPSSTSTVALTSSVAFYSKRMSVNSAPVIEARTAPRERAGPPSAVMSSYGGSTSSGAASHRAQYGYGR